MNKSFLCIVGHRRQPYIGDISIWGDALSRRIHESCTCADWAQWCPPWGGRVCPRKLQCLRGKYSVSVGLKAVRHSRQHQSLLQACVYFFSVNWHSLTHLSISFYRPCLRLKVWRQEKKFLVLKKKVTSSCEHFSIFFNTCTKSSSLFQ